MSTDKKTEESVAIEKGELEQWHKILIECSTALLQINVPVGQAHIITRPVNGILKTAETIQLLIPDKKKERKPQVVSAEKQAAG